MKKDNYAKSLFLGVVLVFIFLFGFYSGVSHHFPYSFIQKAQLGYYRLKRSFSEYDERWYYRKNLHSKEAIYIPELAYQGLNLISRIGPQDQILVDIRDMKGKLIHSWNLDWFRLWPNATHLPEKFIPQERPGTHVHGMVLTQDGDLIFNYEEMGLVKVNKAGQVLWKLPYQTHHSIHQDERGHLWVSGLINHEKRVPEFPIHFPDFFEPTILEVSPDGKILQEISVIKLLRKNGLLGLLFMKSLNAEPTRATGDTLHLNDIEPFPKSMPEGFFKQGDVMISLRNINGIFVFENSTQRIKYYTVGTTAWQHDPDFIDGNTISVYDNNSLGLHDPFRESRIIKIRVGGGQKTIFRGSKKFPFFSFIMGKHQWLENGNILITEAMRGRAFEITSDGQVVWEYRNNITEDLIGIVEEVQRIPDEIAQKFL